VVIACIVAGLGGLFFWANATGVTNFVKTYFLIRTQALSPPPATTLIEGAIEGMVDSMNDPYSVYLNKEDYQDLNAEIEGSFGGIGVVLDQDNSKHLVIVSVLPGTPASAAGLRSGDIFAQIDGKDAAQMSTSDAARLLRGDIGTTVTVKVWRQQDNRYLTITMKREQILVPSSTGEILPGYPDIAYIQLTTFNQDSTLPQLSQALAALKKKGYRALILDLRDNPGGDLQTAVEVASYFIPPGPVVRIVDRAGTQAILQTDRNIKYVQVPLVVLVDGGTASASEIVSGAVKDSGSGTLIGTKTFGKGVVQTVFNLSGQAGVKLTTDKYLTPKGNDINKKGITPDIVVNQSTGGQPDLQLEKAIQILEAKIGQPSGSQAANAA
jgi:carboxyl-terminal processing protease